MENQEDGEFKRRRLIVLDFILEALREQIRNAQGVTQRILDSEKRLLEEKARLEEFLAVNKADKEAA